uniref:Uncharacterized protein n=1 Tax=Fagus sylvatica TaxID=28930 RepID=A0A2N9H4Y0_FAGSY
MNAAILRLSWRSYAATVISGIALPPPSEFRCARYRQGLNPSPKTHCLHQIFCSKPPIETPQPPLDRSSHAGLSGTKIAAIQRCTLRLKILPAVTPHHTPSTCLCHVSPCHYATSTLMPSQCHVISTFIKGRKLWFYVTGEMKKPIKGSSKDEDAFRIRLIEWDSNNHQILTWLRNTSIPSISNLLGNFDDFIWTNLILLNPPWDTPNDAMRYATRRDQMRFYQFLMALHDDYEPVCSQLLHQIPIPSLDAALNELVREETRLQNLTSSEQAQCLGYYVTSCTPSAKHGHTIETCYHRNRSTAAVTQGNTDQTPIAAVAPAHSGSTITLTTDQLEDIIAQALVRAGNASSSSALSVLPRRDRNLGSAVELGVLFEISSLVFLLVVSLLLPHLHLPYHFGILGSGMHHLPGYNS